MNLPSEVRDELERLATTPILLVGSDYDGVLAPIVDDPAAALPIRESIAALRALSQLADTHVAVVSGRALRDLALLSRLPHEVHLVGSHGSEFEVGFATGFDADTIALRDRLGHELDAITEGLAGVALERKPASVAVHYRMAAPEVGDWLVADIVAGPAALEGVTVKRGKMVIELAVVAAHKGHAIERLRHLVGADAVLFFGDDVTDEDAFEMLTGPDLGVKVGGGDTLASMRVDEPIDVARALAWLADARRDWLEGALVPPIEAHSLLSDRRTVALVAPDARVTWMCVPRADSPSVFGELLGTPTAGFFSIEPLDGSASTGQRYVDDSFVLETSFASFRVVDYLDRSDDDDHSRLFRVVEGTGSFRVEFHPRPDYGRVAPKLLVSEDELVVRGEIVPLHLSAPGVEWEITESPTGDVAVAAVELDGEPVVFQLLTDDEIALADEPAARAATIADWHSWAERLDLPDAGGLGARSALVLKALCNESTGAILAAATTSLPGAMGGIRNWDYRFCWPRDAAMTAAALIDVGSLDEAESFIDWLIERVEALPSPEYLRPVYPLSGDAVISEAVIPTLAGYRGSRPVRIGNVAEHQVQLDVFGPIVALVAKLAAARGSLRDGEWRLVVDMAAAVAARWREPDNGMWEERRPQRHHVHSKTMCWMALDRAIALGEGTGRTVPESWRSLRQAIADEVLDRGWNEQRGAFTIAYGDDELDAGVLWIALSGLCAADDPRFASTVRAIDDELRVGAAVHRYLLDDGLPGREGGFVICATWLIEAYVLLGELDVARALVDDVVALAGPTGLIPEQWDAIGGVMLGNHPQAYSHLGLLRAAARLERAEALVPAV